MVRCFGGDSDEEDGLFYSGISFKLHIPQFQIGLVGPTSTSMAREVAWRFAGERGMMVVLEGGGSRCFDASWLSNYPEERERIFFGSDERSPLVAIVIVQTAKNYKAALAAYSKFDALFSGGPTLYGSEKMSATDLEIVTESLRWLKGGEDAVEHSKLYLFILETFYSFVLHKKMVYLVLGLLNYIKENEIVQLVLNPLWMRGSRGNKPKNANLLRPFVFGLFEQVHQIRINAGHGYAFLFPFDLLSFLGVLQTVELPETLRIIIVEGGWVKRAFTAKVQQKYAAAKIQGKVVVDENSNKTLFLKL